MKTGKIVLIIGIVGIFLSLMSTSVVSAFSMPLTQPIVITFGDSPQVRTTTSTFMSEYPHASVMSYGSIHSLGNVLQLMRTHAPLIIIGHGSDQGIGFGGKIIQWQTLNTELNALPANAIYYLACDSATAVPTSTKQAFGFNSAVDGPSGAMIIAATLYNNQGQTLKVQQTIIQLINHVKSLESGNVRPSLLYLGPAETAYWEIRIPVDILFALVAGLLVPGLGDSGLSDLEAYVTSVLFADFGNSLFAFLVDFEDFAKGSMDLVTFLYNTVSELAGVLGIGFSVILGYLNNHCGIFSLGYCVALAAMTVGAGLQIYGAIVTGGSLLVGEIIGISGVLFSDASGFLLDYYDANDVPNA